MRSLIPMDLWNNDIGLRFTGEKGLIKKAKAKDALVKQKFSEYVVYPLSATKKLSKAEKLKDEAMTWFTAFLPGIGCFDSGTDIVNAVQNLNNTLAILSW